MANIFMKIDDVAGEAEDADHKNWIQCEHVAFSYRSETSETQGTGLAVGALVPSPVGVSTVEGEHIVRLLNLQGKGQHFKEVKIEFTKQGAGDNPKKYKSIIMKDAMIQDYQPNGSANAGGTEHLTFAYALITIEYFKQNERGILSSVGSSTYNTKTNKVS